MKMLNFNYSKGRHCPLVVGFQQSQFSPSLARIFICHQTRTPTLLSGLGRQCVVIHNTACGSQKQIGECRTHGRLLCGWDHCHSISGLWSDNQHCLQAGYHIPCHNWRHPPLHVSRLYENVLSNIGKKRK